MPKYTSVRKMAKLCSVEGLAILGLEILWFCVGCLSRVHHEFFLAVSEAAKSSVATERVLNVVVAKFALILGSHLFVAFTKFSAQLSSTHCRVDEVRSRVLLLDLSHLLLILGQKRLRKVSLKGFKGGHRRQIWGSEFGDVKAEAWCLSRLKEWFCFSIHCLSVEVKCLGSRLKRAVSTLMLICVFVVRTIASAYSQKKPLFSF